MEGTVRFLKVDSDAEAEVATTLQVEGLPTILLINEMSVIMRLEGAFMADELEQLVRMRRRWDGGKRGGAMAVQTQGHPARARVATARLV